MSPVETRKSGAVLVISANNPPVNALSHAVRSGLRDSIEAGCGDETIKAMVIACEGRTFFAGADITVVCTMCVGGGMGAASLFEVA